MVRACGVSDAGPVRKTNEDTFVSAPDVHLFAIADGMGGHSAGEVASRLAIDAITDFIRRSSLDSDLTWPYGFDQTISVDANRLRTAIQLANRSILRAAERTQDYSGMGTTIVGALVNGGRAAIGHVGDSRLYLLRKGQLQQVTEDDSWAATILSRDPSLGPADIARHPMRNVLTSVLGAREHVDIHLSEIGLQGGEVMLLCSDGLHGVLDRDTLHDILSATTDVKATAYALVEAAMDSGSRDNVTALVVRYDADADRP